MTPSDAPPPETATPPDCDHCTESDCGCFPPEGTVTLCICGVVTGGHRAPHSACPIHALAPPASLATPPAKQKHQYWCAYLLPIREGGIAQPCDCWLDESEPEPRPSSGPASLGAATPRDTTRESEQEVNKSGQNAVNKSSSANKTGEKSVSTGEAEAQEENDHCSRCGKDLGKRHNWSAKFTSGYYVVAGDYWGCFARPGEVFVCDACMMADPRFDYGQRAVHGVPMASPAVEVAILTHALVARPAADSLAYDRARVALFRLGAHITEVESQLTLARQRADAAAEALRAINAIQLDQEAPIAEEGEAAAADYWRERAYRMARLATAQLSPHPGPETVDG